MKELIERLQTLVELSPQTKQSLLDKRKQNALDAIAKWKKADDLVGDIPDELQQVLDGTFKGTRERTLADVVVPNLDKITDEQLQNILEYAYTMEPYHSLFPSGWDEEKHGDYPRKLAQALVNSTEEESFGDLINIYYNRRNFLAGCADIFRNDLGDKPGFYLHQLVSEYGSDNEYVEDTLKEIYPEEEELVIKMLDDWANRWPEEYEEFKNELPADSVIYDVIQNQL